jgi:hypothetical protein
MKNDILFAYNDFYLMNIDEKLYPVNNEFNLDYEMSSGSGSNKLDNANAQQKYCIPKSALMDQLENIPNEIYYSLLYGVSKYLCDSETKKIIHNFYERVTYHGKNLEKKIILDKNKIVISKIIEKIAEFKKLLPDMLNTTEANNALFKVNKYNELFNPLDECLTQEINNYNNFLTSLYTDMTNILSIVDGNMFMISEYEEIINDLNKNKVPRKWSLSKYGNSTYNTIDSWLERIKYIFSEFNKWISEGFLNIYDLSIFSDEKLFITLLPIYFQKKLSEKKSKVISSDRIKLEFKLTKIEPLEEITEEKINEYKRINLGEDFIFIKGFKIKGFKGHQENPRDVKTYRELEPEELNTNEKNWELLPVIAVSYTVKEFQVDSKIANKTEKDENDDEDEEENEMLLEEKNEIKAEKRVKSKEMKIIEENKKVEMKETKEEKMVQKVKIKYYKKHCKLEIPLIEESLEEIYEINEPIGTLEIRFNCDKYRQEEYFINKDIKLILDK